MSMFGQRILILIPHPDDEVVGCAAAIARARAQGARVYGCVLSHGYLPYESLWPFQRGGHEARVDARLEEMQAAAEFLGMTIVAQNTTRAARQIWQNLPEVKKEIKAAMQHCAPDRIWVPAYEGGNPDHDGVNAVASTLRDMEVFEFSEYNLYRGANSNRFVDTRGGEVVHRLTPEEKRMKRQAMHIYKSEAGNIGGLKTHEEQFRPLPKHDYAKRPHAGKLWYERFQWVPFKHPQVDYTKAEEVSAAIGKFLQGR